MPLFNIFLAIVIFSTSTNAADTNDTVIIMLEDESEIALAKGLNEDIDNLSDKVMSCMDAGNSNELCMCKNLDLLYEFLKDFDETINNHPKWIGQNVSFMSEKEDGTSEGVTLNFIGLQRQYDMIESLECNE